MPKIKYYGYEQLNDMDAAELIQIRNRIASRINNRNYHAQKANAPLQFQTVSENVPVRRSNKSKERFKEMTHTEQVAETWELEQLSREQLTTFQLQTQRNDLLEQVKILVGQTYEGYHHDEAYKSGWVDRLSDSDLIKVRDAMQRMRVDTEDKNDLWYLIKSVSYISFEIEPIRSKEDLFNLLGITEEQQRVQEKLKNTETPREPEQKASSEDILKALGRF